MLSDYWLKYILIGRNNKIPTTVLPSTNRSFHYYFASWKIQLFENSKSQTKITQSVLFFILIFQNVVYYKLHDKIVVQILVINIETCFARSYNVFLADLKLL